MKNERIVVGNLPEAFINFLAKDQTNTNQLLKVEHSLDDQAIFWEGNNSLVVSSSRIPPIHMRHVEKALGYNNVEIATPKNITGRLSSDIISDPELFQQIVDRTTQHPEPTNVTPYCVTPEFVSLIDKLVNLKANISTPELPDKQNRWVVKSIDLKSGFRQLCSGLLADSPIQIPQGFACNDLEQVVAISYFFSKNGKPCIVKPNDGEDGMGQLVFQVDSDLNFILNAVAQNPFLKDGNAIVEEYIESDADVLSPSIEYRIINGKLEYLYSCKQTLSKTGTFLGVDVGPNVLPEKIENQMLQAGNAFGGALVKLGYRGFFDMDFIVGKDQAVYAVESNLRRTGATHVHSIGTQLWGNDYESKVFLRSSDVDPCVPLGMPIDEVFSRLEDTLYPNLGPDKGVIITVSSGIENGRLGYVIAGRSLKEIENIQDNLRSELA